MHARGRGEREQTFGSGGTTEAALAFRDEKQSAARCAHGRRTSRLREIARQLCRFGGHVPVLNTHGPLGGLHLTQLECESNQKVGGVERALQLPQPPVLRSPDGRYAVRCHFLWVVAAACCGSFVGETFWIVLHSRWLLGLPLCPALRLRRVACPHRAAAPRVPGEGLHPPGGQDAAAAGDRVAGRLPLLLMEHGRPVHTRVHHEGVDSVRDGVLLERPPWGPSRLAAS